MRHVRFRDPTASVDQGTAHGASPEPAGQVRTTPPPAGGGSMCTAGLGEPTDTTTLVPGAVRDLDRHRGPDYERGSGDASGIAVNLSRAQDRPGDCGDGPSGCNSPAIPARQFYTTAAAVVTAVSAVNDLARAEEGVIEGDSRPHVSVWLYGRKFSALINTSATLSYVGDQVKDLCSQWGLTWNRVKAPTVQRANGSQATITRAYELELTIGESRITNRLYYLTDLSVDLMLGMDILSRLNLSLVLFPNAAQLDNGSRTATRPDGTADRGADMVVSCSAQGGHVCGGPKRILPSPDQWNPPGSQWKGRPVTEPGQSPGTAATVLPAVMQDHRPHVQVRMYGGEFTALVDTGSVRSYVGDRVKDFCSRRGVQLLPVNAPAVQLANGDLVAITSAYQLEFVFENQKFSDQWFYLPKLSSEMVLGMDILRKYGFVVDLRTEVVYLAERAPAREMATVAGCASRPPRQPPGAKALGWNEEAALGRGTGVHRPCPKIGGPPPRYDGTGTADEVSSPAAPPSAERRRSRLATEGSLSSVSLTLTPQEEVQLAQFLDQELPSLADIRGTTDLVQHRIRLSKPEPIKQRYRPQNPRMQDIINQEVDEMIQLGVIEPSNSPWSSPVVIVRKKDGKPRFCIDFRKVNEVSERDAYPLPYINAILDKLRKARYISSIDLKQGYWQIPLTPDSKPITAFTVPGRGLFQFRVMPFGLHSAPATFQRLLDRIIGPDMDPHAFAYLDDIIVLGETFEGHLTNLREVFRRLRVANLQLNPEKCQFCRKSLKYLGHVVTAEGIKTDPEKVESIQKFPTPRTVRDVRRFLGMASWYRRFVPAFSQIVTPLTRLLRKDVRFKWATEQEDAFAQLKTCLTESPVLTCPDFSQPFTLQTDASDRGLGAALTQCTGDYEQVIAYASRTLSPAEKNYSVTERECLAIVWGIEKMRPYLEGYHFTVITDHQSLRWLHSIKSPAGRLARWSIFLQQYDFEIKYRKGALNRVADTLSRQPLSLPSSESGTHELCAMNGPPECSWYQKKKAEVEKNPESCPDYCIRDDRLYRHWWDPGDLTEPELVEPWKLCVPTPLRLAVLQENHDAPPAGHMGIAKTIARISLRYYWPGMFRDIAKYVRDCLSCKRYKVAQQQTPGKMQPSVNRLPWETVCTDFVGPLPRSKKGNRYIAVFQDRFTKWIQCRPLRAATAKNVCQALYEEVITRFGCPRIIISDNGSQFDSKLFCSLLEEMGIRHRFTPPYTPQANPVERANRTIKTMIAQYCETDHRTWDQYLPDVQLAINSARHDSTGFSPAFLNFGRELELPNSLHRKGDTPSADDLATDTGTTPDYACRLAKHREVFDLVRVKLARAFSTQSHHYNLRRRDWQCHVGDRVMRREHTLSSAVRNFASKLAPKYSGPYTVTKVVSPVVYDLKSASGKKITRVHIKELKPA